MKTETIRIPRTVAAWVSIRRHRSDKLCRLLVADEVEVPSALAAEAPLVARIRDSRDRGSDTRHDVEYRFHDGRYWRAASHGGDRIDAEWLSRRAGSAAGQLLPSELNRILPKFEESRRSEFHAAMFAEDKDVLRWELAADAGPDVGPDDLLLVDGALHVLCGEPVACVSYGSEFLEWDAHLTDFRGMLVPLDLPSSGSLSDAVLAEGAEELPEFGRVETFGRHVFSDFLRLNLPVVWHGLLGMVDGIDASDVERTAVPLEKAVRCLRDCRLALDGEMEPADAIAAVPAALEAVRPFIDRDSDLDGIRRVLDVAFRTGLVSPPSVDRDDASIYAMEF